MKFERYPDEETVVRDAGHGFIAAAWAGNGESVTLPDGSVLPRDWMYVDQSGPAGAPFYVVEFHVDDGGVPRVVTVLVCQRAGGREVIASDLRRLRPLENILEDGVALVAFREEASQDRPDIFDLRYPTAPERDQARRALRGVRRADRRVFTDERAAEVADVYVANMAAGSPTKAVREHFGIAESTASLYVKRARPLIDKLIEKKLKGSRRGRR